MRSSSSFTNQEIGKRIYDLRKSLNITRDTLSEYLDISPGHLRLIETGERSTKVSRYIDMAHIFNVSLDYLLTGQCKLSNIPPTPTNGTFTAYERLLGEHDFQLLIKIAKMLMLHNHDQHETAFIYELLQYQLQYIHSGDSSNK